MKPVDARALIVDRLEKDLIGPLRDDETLEGKRIKPSDVYLSGLLWPMGDRMDAGDDDGSFGDDEDEDGPSSATVVGQQRPCSMGLSFAASSTTEEVAVTVSIHFATYNRSTFRSNDGEAMIRWTRKPFEFHLNDIRLPRRESAPLLLTAEGLNAKVEVHFRTIPCKSALLTTVTLINRSQVADSEPDLAESLTLFQTAIVVRPREGTLIVPRPPLPAANDEDQKPSALLYRDCHEFAAGHQCSVEWHAENGHAALVKTTWLPKAFVPAFKEDGSEEFSALVQSGGLDARILSEATEDSLYQYLQALPDAYGEWIAMRRSEVDLLHADLKDIAREHLNTCQNVCNRMISGIDALKRDKHLRNAFRYANAAMAIQHSWKGRQPLSWRPFQLGFILLAAESACIPGSNDRETLDLLWFPTGGGKTEGYLAIIAMLAWYRRLNGKSPDAGIGNAAVMRYTLRLLTAQQFERATSMILACELLRRGIYSLPHAGESKVRAEFSIGLWVGKDATPNKFAKALETRGHRDGPTAEQIEECPCCHHPARWSYDETEEKVQPFCENPSCDLGPRLGKWPVFTVDSDIYREKPTLLIGTVDKFAQLPFKREVADLFGFGRNHSTDLIIQDELHLISGPLGTIAGLYETAFDWLLRKNGRRPKVIGSTATIRRAEQQVRALFDRKGCQFPPPGLSYDNSGFAVVDHERPGRMYAGITTAGRSAKFSLQAAAGSLLHSGGPASNVPDDTRDGYATLLCYFNSLRELGGAIVQMLDDVPDSVDLYAARRKETARTVSLPRELTSRVSQKEIIEILGELKRRAGDPDCVDVVLATNMVSVGVDVPRLGLMIVNGQPKTRSEYIQSTSRVGRSAYPGLVVSVLNASKARDRSHFETFPAWHGTIYRDVEATSVTPFSSRARDRALHAVLVAMIRHGDRVMADSPRLDQAPDHLLRNVVSEIERRIAAIDAREVAEAGREIDDDLDDWETRAPTYYIHSYRANTSLLQYAENYARKIAAGRLPGAAWPTMNTMRSVEPSSRFRIAEILAEDGGRGRHRNAGDGPDDEAVRPQPRWRNRNA